MFNKNANSAKILDDDMPVTVTPRPPRAPHARHIHALFVWL